MTEAFIDIIKKEFSTVNLSGLLIYMVLVFLIVHVSVLIYSSKKRKSISLGNEILVIALFCYIGIIASLTYFNREADSVSRVFMTKLLWWEDNIAQNITNILNIIFYIPFGILLISLENRDKGIKRIIYVVCCCFLLSLFFEVAKYITGRGYFEIDNIEANIIGGLLGSIIVCVVGRILNRSRAGK